VPQPIILPRPRILPMASERARKVPERNTVKVEAAIGHCPVEFLGNAATLNKLNSQLNAALKDLGMASY